jgi:2-iminobutanoate/2-iminopropanoate deaminase
MRREVIDTPNAPHTGLPYSQAIRYGGLVFVAGQTAFNPVTGLMEPGDIRSQTRLVLDNTAAILAAAGTSLDYALEAICFLADVADFPAFNDVYRSYFPTNGPPRTTVQAALPIDGLRVEIRVIAGMPD